MKGFEFPDLLCRNGDSVDRFFFFVEQLLLSVEMLQSDRLAQQRLTLVAVDNLAEVLLSEHAERWFYQSDEATWMEMPTFTTKERRAITRQFEKRVDLALREADGRLAYRFPKPLVNEFDGIVMKVGHRYRNDLYHVGRHNPTLLVPLTGLYAQAVARMFPRSFHVDVGLKISQSQESQLRSWGWQPEENENYFRPRAAAQQISSRVGASISVNNTQLASDLTDDLEARCDDLSESIDGFRIDRLSTSEIEERLKQALLWGATRGDQVLIRLKEEQRRLVESPVPKDEPGRTAFEQRLRANEQAQWEHIMKTEREFVAPFDLHSIEKFRRRAALLSGLHARLPALLERYQGLDGDLSVLEGSIAWMSFTWDKYLDEQFERSRGN
jgi:hypothetical protein